MIYTKNIVQLSTRVVAAMHAQSKCALGITGRALIFHLEKFIYLEKAWRTLV